MIETKDGLDLELHAAYTRRRLELRIPEGEVLGLAACSDFLFDRFFEVVYEPEFEYTWLQERKLLLGPESRECASRWCRTCGEHTHIDRGVVAVLRNVVWHYFTKLGIGRDGVKSFADVESAYRLAFEAAMTTGLVQGTTHLERSGSSTGEATISQMLAKTVQAAVQKSISKRLECTVAKIEMAYVLEPGKNVVLNFSPEAAGRRAAFIYASSHGGIEASRRILDNMVDELVFGKPAQTALDGFSDLSREHGAIVGAVGQDPLGLPLQPGGSPPLVPNLLHPEPPSLKVSRLDVSAGFSQFKSGEYCIYAATAVNVLGESRLSQLEGVPCSMHVINDITITAAPGSQTVYFNLYRSGHGARVSTAGMKFIGRLPCINGEAVVYDTGDQLRPSAEAWAVPAAESMVISTSLAALVEQGEAKEAYYNKSPEKQAVIKGKSASEPKPALGSARCYACSGGLVVTVNEDRSKPRFCAGCRDLHLSVDV
jgi:hypothetical protein